MASREIRHLSQRMQVLYNKFHDKCRRDTELLKNGVSIFPLCTYREKWEQERVGGDEKFCATLPDGTPASGAITVVATQYGDLGLPDALDARIEEHANSVGLVRSPDYEYTEK